ncbi:MAG TPA: undecaprenyldiphospho-muramoylpentapeptide beta-N-acetylglucosaminyltransferase [Parachlamydiaceae bacterium]|nr:undecaprenyldiphospho-muramoylpentapeptide beta-N-acetylglucosaminyltransferase [Parachlamydiaceae bacterium]
MPRKIMIATGGTGGHIYPAMALAQQFAMEQNDAEILFVGGGLAQNRYFDRNEFDYRTVSCGAFTNRSPLSLLRSCSNISRGIWQSCAIIREFRPDVVVGFGSYYSFPPLIAAKLKSVPLVLHEANSIPGKVNRLLAPYACATGVHFPQTLGLIKGKKYEVGMPLRTGFKKASVAVDVARKYFGLQNGLTTLLVFGGSQGSNVINKLFPEALLEMCCAENRRFQVIHIAGDIEEVQRLEQGYRKLGVIACVKVFEGQMGLAWQVADLVVSRSGASSIAEQLEYEVPGILIPFARAADDHQNHNADFLVDTVGGALKVQEKELSAVSLGRLISGFLENDGQQLKSMSKAMGQYKLMSRSLDLLGLIKKVVGSRTL